MAKQAPPSRPWFRLPNFGRPAAVAAAPPPPPAEQPQLQPTAPQPPRLPIVRPGFAQTFRANLAQPQPTPPQQPPPSTTRSRPPTAASASAPPRPTSVASSPPPPPAPNVASSPTPAMTSPRTFGISSPPTIKSSESTPKQSPMKSTMLSSASPRNSPPPSIKSLATSSPPKSVSSPATKATYSPTPTALPKAVAGSAQSSPSPQSPIRATRSPSPISLPPSQLQSSKAEAVQETVDKQVIYPASNGNSVNSFFNAYNNSNKYGSFKETDDHNLFPDSKDVRNARVVTMAGNNKGAVMDLGINGHTGNDAGESDGFHSGSADWSPAKNDKEIPSHLPRNAYVNSNVQGVNDSILYNCSINHHDPGVHFSLSRKPINGNNKSNGHGYKYYANGKQL